MARLFRAFVMTFALTAACDSAVTGSEPTQPAQTEAALKVKPGKGNAICTLKCMAPPEGCEYEGAFTTGPCNKVTCGEVVCDSCPLPNCAPPPDGCTYQNTNVTTCPYSCGQLVCDGTSL